MAEKSFNVTFVDNSENESIETIEARHVGITETGVLVFYDSSMNIVRAYTTGWWRRFYEVS